MSATEPTPVVRRKRRPPSEPSGVVEPKVEQVETREEMEARIRAEIEAEVAAKYAAGALEDDPADAIVPEFKNASADDPNAVTIHFVEDGFTAFGKIWYRGEELTVVQGSEEWESLRDRKGEVNAWMLLDEDQQVARFGRRFFRPGKWRGRSFDVDDPSLNAEERNQLVALMGGTPVHAGASAAPSFLASGTT